MFCKELLYGRQLSLPDARTSIHPSRATNGLPSLFWDNIQEIMSECHQPHNEHVLSRMGWTGFIEDSSMMFERSTKQIYEIKLTALSIISLKEMKTFYEYEPQ